jgi:hypothetical protein
MRLSRARAVGLSVFLAALGAIAVVVPSTVYGQSDAQPEDPGSGCVTFVDATSTTPLSVHNSCGFPVNFKTSFGDYGTLAPGETRGLLYTGGVGQLNLWSCSVPRKPVLDPPITGQMTCE